MDGGGGKGGGRQGHPGVLSQRGVHDHWHVRAEQLGGTPRQPTLQPHGKRPPGPLPVRAAAIAPEARLPRLHVLVRWLHPHTLRRHVRHLVRVRVGARVVVRVGARAGARVGVGSPRPSPPPPCRLPAASLPPPCRLPVASLSPPTTCPRPPPGTPPPRLPYRPSLRAWRARGARAVCTCTRCTHRPSTAASRRGGATISRYARSPPWTSSTSSPPGPRRCRSWPSGRRGAGSRAICPRCPCPPSRRPPSRPCHQ